MIDQEHAIGNFSEADSERLRRILQHHRKKVGMSQTELAARVGVGRSTLVRIERHPEMTSLGTFYRIAKELGIPPRSVLKRAQQTAPKMKQA